MSRRDANSEISPELMLRAYTAGILAITGLRPLAKSAIVFIDHLMTVIFDRRIVGMLYIPKCFIASNGICNAIATAEATHRQPAGFQITIDTLS